MRTRLVPVRWTLAAVALASYGQIGSRAQNTIYCSTNNTLTVHNPSSLDELYSYLDGAKNCEVESSISVDWNATVEVSRTITVPGGVELRVNGSGYVYGDNVINMSGTSSSDGDGNTAASMDSVIRGNGDVRLFRVNKTGNLFISGMTLQNGWGGIDGGGIEALEGATVVSDSCLWESLSASESGGAIAATGMSNLTLRGTNIFSNCSATQRGGAIYLDGTTLSGRGDLRFENCTAGGKGGGMYIKEESELRVAEGAFISFSGCSVGSNVGDAGGGLFSMNSKITVGANARVSFKNNSVPASGDGGGLYGQNTSITVSKGANLSFVDNYAEDDGGGMYLEGNAGENDEEDIITCLTLPEGANVEFFRNSVAGYGGGVEFSSGCDVMITGDVHFEQNNGQRGGAMYMDASRVVISGRAAFVNNSAERWGGAVMLIDFVKGLELNGPVIFQNNSAGRSGGAINLENTILNVTADENVGALWEGNSAGYDGGVVAVDGGEVYLQGGFASSNSADQRGGVLFATGESSLSWTAGESCDNSAASGGSLYISNSDMNLTDVYLGGDHTPSGGVIFLAGANVRAVNVSIVAPDELVGDFALHVDADSEMKAFSCSFEEWSGEYNLIVSEGQLVLDACNFSQSSNVILFSSVEAATIRNAILGDNNYASTGYNASTVFGSDTNTCSTLPGAYSCLSNESGDNCVDADYGMGVLCAEYTVAATGENVSLSRGNGSLVELVTTSVSAPSSAADVVYYPDLVEEELILRFSFTSNSESWSSSEGEDVLEMATEAVLWELRSSNGSNGGSPTDKGVFYDVSADNFSWVAVPASGILMKDQEVTISIVGTSPPVEDPQRPSAVYNGEVFATFHVLSRTADAGSTTNSSTADLNATYYYCPAEEYWDGGECALCVELMSTITDGEGSLECDMPGVTLETLPLAPGYWRGDVNKTIIESCLLADACKGGRGIIPSSTLITSEAYPGDSRYCETGYTGPYCAVCAGGYRRLSGYQCLNCEGDWDAGALIAFWFMVAITPVLLISLMLFLLGGTTSFKQLRKKISRICGRSKPAGVTQWGSEKALEAAAVEKQNEEEERAARSRKMERARGFGALLLRSIPFQQLKILIVVWQILTQFSSMTEIPYPSTYKRFLSTLDVFNFDISWPLSAMCLVGEIHFYEKLLIVTLGPIILLGLLGLSYRGAMRWHRGTDRDAVENRRQATVRHASTVLLVLFLVFSSVSTTIFSTFSCDYVDDFEVWLLRADYSIPCYGDDYAIYQAYAGVMIIVYPIGIPMLFAFLLLNRRDKINPLAATEHPSRATPLNHTKRAFPERQRCIAVSRAVAVTDFPISAASSSALRANGYGVEEARPAAVAGRASQGVRVQKASEEPCEPTRQEVLQKRAQDLDLQPTKFLWEPYEPRIYYYETVECGRRCLMTGALVFVLPNTAGQLAGACIFAFISLLGFELIRPHLCATDAWMYRIGCIVIFFSNFLGLMAKTDVSGEDSQSQELFGVLLVCIHATMFLAIVVQSFLAMQATSESRDDLVDGLLAKTRSRESLVRRSATFDSGDGTNLEAPRVARSPERHGASKSADTEAYDRTLLSRPGERDGIGIAHQFDQEGSSTVVSTPRIHEARPVARTWFAGEPTVAYRPQDSFAGHLTGVPSRWPRGYRDLDALNARSDRIFGSSGSASDPTQAPQLDSNPSAWGGEFSSFREVGGGGVGTRDVVGVSGDKYLPTGLATAPAGNSDPTFGMFNSNNVATTDDSVRRSLGRQTPARRRGLLHRLRSNGTAGISSPILPFAPSPNRPDDKGEGENQ